MSLTYAFRSLSASIVTSLLLMAIVACERAERATSPEQTSTIPETTTPAIVPTPSADAGPRVIPTPATTLEPVMVEKTLEQEGPVNVASTTQTAAAEPSGSGVPLPPASSADDGFPLKGGVPLGPVPPPRPSASTPGSPSGTVEAPVPRPRAPLVPPALRPVLSASDNLLSNGTFEAQPTKKDPVPSWVVPKGAKVLVDEKISVTPGTKSLRVEIAGNTNFAMATAVEVLPGKQYLMRGFIKTENLVGNAFLEVQDVTPGAEKVLGATGRITGTSDWTPVGVFFVPSADTKSVTIFLRRPSVDNMDSKAAKEAKAIIWFDHCELLEVFRGNRKNLLDDVLTALRPLSPWLYVPTEGAVVSRDEQSAPPLTGATDSLRLEQLLPSLNLGIMRGIQLTPNEEYLACAYIRTRNLPGSACIEVQDAVKGPQAFMKQSAPVTGTSDWTLVTIRFRVPAQSSGNIGFFLRRPTDEKTATTGSEPATVWFAACGLFEFSS